VLDAGAFFRHFNSFWAHRDQENVLFCHYDDLTADLTGQMQRVATFLRAESTQPAFLRSPSSARSRP
jgi:hypothetical protein